MASKSTNDAVAALARRHAAERGALKAAVAAGEAVRRAQERRAVEVARLDAVVTEAEGTADVALAVLAELVRPDVAAQLTSETAARVRLGQQRADAGDVAVRVERLTDGAETAGRRGRRGAVARARRGGAQGTLGGPEVSAGRAVPAAEAGADSGAGERV